MKKGENWTVPEFLSLDEYVEFVRQRIAYHD